MGDLSQSSATHRIDARGMAVTPGFINMLSWASESLIHDGRSQSDIRQGVTLEVFGEGWSMGPLNTSMKRDKLRGLSGAKHEVNWTTLAEYLDRLVEHGVSPNVASLVGATTALTSSDMPTGPPTPKSLTVCGSWCVRKWSLVRWWRFRIDLCPGHVCQDG